MEETLQKNECNKQLNSVAIRDGGLFLLHQEKQQHLKEEDGSLNQIAVVDYLASMVSLSTIRPTLLIQYFTQDQIDQIMKSYYFHLIEFSVFFIFNLFFIRLLFNLLL